MSTNPGDLPQLQGRSRRQTTSDPSGYSATNPTTTPLSDVPVPAGWPGRTRCWLAVVLLSIAPAAVLHALDPAKSVHQFNCQTWSRQSGLPSDKINAIAQTPDGYLWFGTQNGFVRFDGFEFKVMPVSVSQAGGQEVRRMSAARDGGLWFAVANGGFGHLDGKRHSVNGDIGLGVAYENALVILEGRRGGMWAGTDSGLYRWDRRVDAPPATFDSSLGTVLALAESPRGDIWIGTLNRGLFRFDGGKARPVDATVLGNSAVWAVTIDQEERVWVGSSAGVRCYDAAGKLQAVLPIEQECKSLVVDRHGVLWIGTIGNGLARWQDGRITYLRKSEGLGDDVVNALLEDAEGSLWVGTQNGLTQLSDLKFPIYSRSEGLVGGGAVAVVASRRGGIWVTTSQGASYFDGKKAVNLQGPPIFSTRYVRRVYEAKNGDLYFVDGDKNIVLVRDGVRIECYANTTWPECFAEDADGVIVGIGPTLFRVREGGLHPYTFQGLPPNFYWIFNLLTASDGTLWVASSHGVFRIKDGQARNWSVPEGLSSLRATALWEEADGSIWAALGTGLARIKGDQLVNVRLADGLFDDRIYAGVLDDHGYCWFASGRGYFRIARQELADFADHKRRAVRCDVFDGLGAVKFTDREDQGSMGCKSADGQLWFPTPHGVVRIDPEHHFRNEVAPPVHLSDIRVNGRPLTAASGVKLDSDGRNIEFSFDALSYIQPNRVKVRYQLEGFDPGWVDAESGRFAHYSGLPAGNYRFRVQAANADGVWNNEGDSFEFELPPPFHRTAWFYGGCTASVFLALMAAYNWKAGRMDRSRRRLEIEKERLEAKVAARTDELARSLSLLQATLDSTADGILAYQFSTGALTYNAQFVAMWRIGPEVLGRGPQAVRQFLGAQVADPETFHRRLSEIDAVPETESLDVIELKDGRVFERYCKPQRLGGAVAGIVVNFRDVTERRQAESALARERDLLRVLMENSPDHIYFKDLGSRFLRVSQAQARDCGAPSAESLIGKTDFDVFSEPHARQAREDEQEILRTGQAVVGKVEKETWTDGRETWVLTSKMPLRNAAGEIVGTYGISKDITALKTAENRLAEAHKQLLETSRQAGMAEVATSVLHNVGNVLTSVNVSATVVADQVRRSKVSYVAKIDALLTENAGRLAEFFADDPRGQKLPGFIDDLARELTAEQAIVLEEIDRLVKNIDHIKHIVAMQQTYAKVAGVSETVRVTQIIEDAVQMNLAALSRHEVRLVRDFQFDPALDIERHKVLQILVNLISNAKYACDASRRPDKRIVVQTTETDGRIRVSVTDNGVGIAAENLGRVFCHGFTTKKDGHGFALHSGSLLAKELGGSLTVHSDGLGTGATFVLELPLSSPGDAGVSPSIAHSGSI